MCCLLSLDVGCLKNSKLDFRSESPRTKFEVRSMSCRYLVPTPSATFITCHTRFVMCSCFHGIHESRMHLNFNDVIPATSEKVSPEMFLPQLRTMKMVSDETWWKLFPECSWDYFWGFRRDVTEGKQMKLRNLTRLGDVGRGSYRGPYRTPFGGLEGIFPLALVVIALFGVLSTKEIVTFFVSRSMCKRPGGWFCGWLPR